MPRFDRYLLIQLLAVFGFFALVLVAVYWVNQAVGLFDQLIGDGQSSVVFLEFSLLTLPNVIRIVLPIAAFAAAIYVANRLMQDSEMVVMQATGFSAFRLARPVLWFGLFVAAMMLALTHFLVPASRAAMDVRYAEISQNVTARFLTDGQFTHPAEGITLYVREIAASGELLDMFLTDARSLDESVTYSAEKALFARTESGPKLLMFDGLAQRFTKGDQRLAVTRFTDFTFDLGGLIKTEANPPRKMEALATGDLLAADPGLLDETGETRAAFLYEAHYRFSQPFHAVATALLGFAALLIGGFSRFGLLRQIMLAIGLLVVLQAVASVATTQALKSERGWPWAYLVPVLGLAMAGGLLWWSQRPRHLRRNPGEVGPA